MLHYIESVCESLNRIAVDPKELPIVEGNDERRERGVVDTIVQGDREKVLCKSSGKLTRFEK